MTYVLFSVFHTQSKSASDILLKLHKINLSGSVSCDLPVSTTVKHYLQSDCNVNLRLKQVDTA